MKNAWLKGGIAVLFTLAIAGCGGDGGGGSDTGGSTSPLLPNTATLPSCAQIGSDPAFGMTGNPAVTNVVATVVPISSSTATAYCQVDFTYNSGKSGPEFGYDIGQPQAIGIRVGLPLRADDGGTGAWNGKIRDIGGAGCVGSLGSVAPATNAGYAGSTNNGGHVSSGQLAAANCEFGVIVTGSLAHTLNAGLLRDFSHDSVLWQARWSKALTKLYYGQPQTRTYWTGCSQGGRQAHIAAQQFPEEYDGIVAGGSAFPWMRFQPPQAWSGLVVKDRLKTIGKDLTAAQVTATTNAAIAACDAQDGVVDGVLGDPRACTWSARSAICGAPGAPAQNCLDPDQAAAYDLIRKGPHNSKGHRIWFPWEPDTTFSTTSTNYLNAQPVNQWALADTRWSSDQHLYLDKAALARSGDPLGITYEDIHTLGTTRVSDLVDVTSPELLGRAKARGVKILSWTGTADKNIQSRNSIKYYRELASAFGNGVSDPSVQDWYRLFLYPGVGHCGEGLGDGPQPGADSRNGGGPLFDALVNWVEKGVTPDRVIATRTIGGAGGTTETRPVCPYPKTAIYKGSGSVNDAANYTCGGNLETQQAICSGMVVKHKQELGSEYETAGLSGAEACPVLPSIELNVSPKTIVNPLAGNETITAVINAPEGVDLSLWDLRDVRLEGLGVPISSSASNNGRTYTFTFDKKTLAHLTAGKEHTVTLTGLLSNPLSPQGVLSVSTTVRVSTSDSVASSLRVPRQLNTTYVNRVAFTKRLTADHESKGKLLSVLKIAD